MVYIETIITALPFCCVNQLRCAVTILPTLFQSLFYIHTYKLKPRMREFTSLRHQEKDKSLYMRVYKFTSRTYNDTVPHLICIYTLK